MAVVLPGCAEADVREADGAPGEDSREAGEGEEPVEGCLLGGGRGEEGEEAHGGSEHDAE